MDDRFVMDLFVVGYEDIMRNSKGGVAQAKNFLRVFRQIPQGSLFVYIKFSFCISFLSLCPHNC